MKSNENSKITRRELGKRVGQVAAVTALSGVAIPSVYAAGEQTIQVVLVGCGGRGTGAAANALHQKAANMKLVAMADAYADRLHGSYASLSRAPELKGKIDVPEDRKFIGYDAYKKAMDCLKPGDIAIFATPLAFRWVHFTYAIEKNLNVFMEKPLSADGAASRRLLALAEKAKEKNLKVGVGLMSRHARHLEELHDRIGNGELGDIILMRGYRMAGEVGAFNAIPKQFARVRGVNNRPMGDLEYQIRRFHAFLWSGGGCFSDFNIHIIDHLSWMKNAWPVQAQAVGGRHYKQDKNGHPYVDQNFDSYGVEYTFEDGTKMLFDGRCIEGAADIYNSFIHGTKGCAIASRSGDCGAPSIIYKGTGEVPANQLWRSADHTDPYENEWHDLVDAIINNKPYNEVKRGVEASVVTSMGRMAAHTGQIITFEQMLNSTHEFAPNIDKITENSPGPLPSDEKGHYPQPEPGRKKTEY